MIDIRDLVFFATLIAGFLFANAVMVDMKKGRLSHDASTPSASSSRPAASPSWRCCSSRSTSSPTQRCAASRVDLTADKLYTLSPGTRSVLSSIDRAGDAALLLSRSAWARRSRSYGVYAGRVREMLQEYRNAAARQDPLEVIDPQPFTR